MSTYFTKQNSSNSIPIFIVPPKGLAAFKKSLQPQLRQWLDSVGFKAKPSNRALLPAKDGTIAAVIVGAAETTDMWAVAQLPEQLPAGTYHIDSTYHPALKGKNDMIVPMAIGWGLACYKFARFIKATKEWPVLFVPAKYLAEAERMVAATHKARDLVNLPTNYLPPLALAEQVKVTGKAYGAKVTVISGDDLIKKNYPAVHAVGRASHNPPCLVDLTWGNPAHPKVTLVGKGVCFDSGGLDIKNAANMKLMKKDMGGAAAMLALAQVLMDEKLPIRLRLLIPAVENSISGDAYRPLDVISTRKGLTVEIGDTDAEGRVILCDALAEADSEKPDLLIDAATLTGAARVALGTDIPAFFTDDDALADAIYKTSKQMDDPLWRLPIHMGYDEMIASKVADLNNVADSGYAGAIIGALYLKHFVTDTKSWVHIDMMAWNVKNRPGRPAGGEAMSVRALHLLIRRRYAA